MPLFLTNIQYVCKQICRPPSSAKHEMDFILPLPKVTTLLGSKPSFFFLHRPSREENQGLGESSAWSLAIAKLKMLSISRRGANSWGEEEAAACKRKAELWSL